MKAPKSRLSALEEYLHEIKANEDTRQPIGFGLQWRPSYRPPDEQGFPLRWTILRWFQKLQITRLRWG